MRCICLLGLAAALAVPAVLADTHLILPDGSGDFPTIQGGISNSDWGDSVVLADGVYTGPGNRDITYQGKPITVCSLSGDPESCIIDCEGTEQENHRGFIFNWGESSSSVLCGVTVCNAYNSTDPDHVEDYGGGFLILMGSSPTIQDVIVRDCYAPRGAAVFIYEGSPAFTGCKFIDNTAWRTWVGGIDGSRASSTEIVDCIFEGNSGNNLPDAVGFLESDEITISGCCFKNHSGDVALLIGWLCTAEISQCTFAGNRAAFICYGDGSMTTMRNCTFYGQTSGYDPACIYVFGGAHVQVENSILSGSVATPVGCGDATINLQCCNVYGNGGGDYVGCIAEFEGIAGNISLDPRFCNPAADDYAILPESPCAPFSEPNPECDLIGAWPVGCTIALDVPQEPEPSLAGLLAAPRPNPFRDRTHLRLHVPAGGERPAALAIYDVAGRLVRQLPVRNAYSQMGTITWEGMDGAGRPAPAGLYFVRCVWNGRVEQQPVLLVR